MTKSLIEGHTSFVTGGTGGGGGVPDDGSVTTAKIVDGAVTSNKILDGTITNADVSPTAAIALSKLAVDPLARANHTGTQLSSTISDFNAAVIAAGGGGGTTITMAANTVLKADVADTPIGLAIAPSTFVGRGAAGSIAALTPSQAKTILAITNTDVSGLGALATKTTIADADVASGAAIALSKLAVDPLARANHTGTQLSTTISDFNAAVTAVAGSSGVAATLFDANTILKADANDTPVALTVGPSTFVGRAASGNIVAMDPATAKTTLAFTTSDIGGLGTLASKSTITSADITDGTITSTDIADATIVNADIALGAAIDLAKLSVDPLARANHTGTQLASTVSNFDTAVRTSRLDQMALPTAPLNVNGQALNGVATPLVATDGVNKAYADNMAAGLVVKASVKAASVANVTIASPGTTLDGVTLAANNRVLLKDQTDATQNGIYTWSAGASPLVRSTDADVDPELSSGVFTFTEAGTTNAGRAWVLNNANPVIIGTTAQQWVQFAGGGTSVVGTTNRITVTGNQIDISAAYVGQASITTLGTVATGTWNATPIAVAKGGTGGTDAATARAALGITGAKYVTTIGNGALTSFTVTHNLNTKDIVVELYETATGLTVLADITRTTVNAITVTGFTAAPTTNQYSVVVMG